MRSGIRLTAICLLCLLLLSLSVLPSFASGKVIRYGAPYLDGEIDAIYRDSARLTVQTEGFYSWGDGSAAPISVECRVLWNENFLFLCTVVKDSTICSVGRDLAADNRKNDGIVCWFTDRGKTFSVMADPFGYVFSAVDGKPSFRMDQAVCAVRCYAELGYYVIEMALPFEGLQEGRELGISLQVNDLSGEGKGTSYAGDVICAENLFTMKDEVADSVTESPEIGDHQPGIPSPGTSDMILIPILVGVIALVVIFLLIRRRK